MSSNDQNTVATTAGDSIIKVIQRFALKSCAWVGIYLLGYWDFSVAWLLTPLLLTVLREQWKKERDFKLSAARHAALSNEKEMIESRIKVEDLPSWVFFPDKERAEWINTILQQLWPNVGHYTRDVIEKSVEPAVKSALEGYGLAGFKFEKIVLGQIPPRITGIKVYDKNVSRNEIIMDVDIIHASDCDIKCSLKRMKVKITDFSLRGLVRVVFKPLITDVPLIGGLQVYFLTPPEIDFDLGGIANALDAPGLSNIIRKIVLEQIGYIMVLPNKFTMPLVDTVQMKSLKCPDSAGILRVRLIKAANLLKKDVGVLGMGKSDPYVVLSVGAKTVESPMICNTVNPEWNFVADFPIEVVRGQQLTLEVLDHDDTGDNDFLGRATIETGVIANKGVIKDMWVDLEDVPSGRVQLTLSWMETTANKASLEAKNDKGLTKCLLHVFIDSCENLDVPKSPGAKPSPQVELHLAKDTQSTWPQYFSNDPVFEQGFVFLVANPDADDLHVKVVDTAHKNSVIGATMIRISDLINQKNMEYCNQPFTLKGGAGGATIKMSANIRCLADPKPASLSEIPRKEPTPSSKEPTPVKVPSPEKKSVSLDDKKPLDLGDVSMDEPGPVDEPKPFKTPVSVDEMVTGTIKPMVESTKNEVDMSELLNPLSQMRKRSPPAAADSCGKIKLSLSYNQDKERLKVIVHQAAGLPGADLPDPPDPYVKMYLLPDKKSKTKRKTDVQKDTTNPIYDEDFEYDIDHGKLSATKLEVSVVDKKGIFARSSLMGRAVVDLTSPEIYSGLTDWFTLEEDDDDSD